MTEAGDRLCAALRTYAAMIRANKGASAIDLAHAANIDTAIKVMSTPALLDLDVMTGITNFLSSLRRASSPLLGRKYAVVDLKHYELGIDQLDRIYQLIK